MVCGEILKVVFPLLKAAELAKCMLVCKQWRDIAQDDYFWKCLCFKNWPSVAKRKSPPALSYYKFFQIKRPRKALLPWSLPYNDLEFYIDIWVGEKIIFSAAVPGPAFQNGTYIPPPGISYDVQSHLKNPLFKMILPVEPRFTISKSMYPLGSVSVLVGRKDTRKVACVIEGSTLRRESAYVVLASGDICPYAYSRIYLLCMDNGNKEVVDVFAIKMDFGSSANIQNNALLLLDWK